MNRPEAETIASAVSFIRPDWLRISLLTMLGRHQHRPARDVMLALVWVAYDPDTKSPGRIDAEGPWWAVSRLAGVDTTPPAPYLVRPTEPIPREPNPAPPETIAAIRAQYRTERTEP